MKADEDCVDRSHTKHETNDTITRILYQTKEMRPLPPLPPDEETKSVEDIPLPEGAPPQLKDARLRFRMMKQVVEDEVPLQCPFADLDLLWDLEGIITSLLRSRPRAGLGDAKEHARSVCVALLAQAVMGRMKYS